MQVEVLTALFSQGEPIDSSTIDTSDVSPCSGPNIIRLKKTVRFPGRPRVKKGERQVKQALVLTALKAVVKTGTGKRSVLQAQRALHAGKPVPYVSVSVDPKKRRPTLVTCSKTSRTLMHDMTYILPSDVVHRAMSLFEDLSKDPDRKLTDASGKVHAARVAGHGTLSRYPRIVLNCINPHTWQGSRIRDECFAPIRQTRPVCPGEACTEGGMLVANSNSCV